MSGGYYIAIFLLGCGARIRVGRLGRFELPVGTYYYVGSALRNRDARLVRHARRRKKRRWHVDYLSTRAQMVGAILVPPDWSPAGPGDGPVECRLAEALSRRMERIVPRFGASDCRCGGHLMFEPLVIPAGPPGTSSA